MEESKHQEFYEYLHEEIRENERKMANCYDDLNSPRPAGTKAIVVTLAIEYSVRADALRDVRTKFLEMFHLGADGWRDTERDCLDCVINKKKIED